MALEMFLSPLISLAVNKSTDELTKQICGLWDMNENRETLEQRLLATKKMIADAQERAVGEPAVKKWMQQLEAAAHEAVDVLDEFQYEALRSKVISQQPSPSTKVIKGCFTHENPVTFRYKMSNKLIKVLCKIDKVVSEMNNFNLIPRDPPPTIDRETQSFVMESEVIGRKCEREQIVSELINPRCDRDNNISVLAIVGIGGAGKTTLAQLVYNDKSVKEHFQLTLWVCVSTNSNVINLTKSIIHAASGKASSSIKEELQKELRNILGKKRYLLVLDDVWNKEKDKWNDKWNELRMWLCSGAGAGSVIMVTTRDQGVASIMAAFSNHNLKELTYKDSLMLFEKRAFVAWDEKQITKKHREIGENIVHKCGGLPLVVNAMAGLLGSEKELCDWDVISKNKVWDNIRSAENILHILKLSYDHLPSHIKQCFAFCAIFPQDYKMERETLVQLWMANDFIPTDGSVGNFESKGRSIFNELYRRSFFQNVQENETFGFSKITCQMHDLMHNLATEIVGNKCSDILEPNSSGSVQQEVHHLGVGDLAKFRGINNILKQFPNIHTCLIDETYGYKQKKKDFYLLKSCSLRALKCRCHNVPKEIGYMKHIRYLDLSEESVTTLPETISMLYNLQTLKLSGCSIKELPSEMRYMLNLRHLFLDGCSELECMPIGLGQLKYLHTLTKYVLNSNKGGNIRELNQLNLLSGKISLSGLESIRDIKDAQTVNLDKKTNLYLLQLKWDKTSINNGGIGNSKPVLEALMPHDKLKYLDIDGYCGSGFPNWMMKPSIISNLKGLKLNQCINCAELPPPSRLPSLEGLHIEKMDNLISIVGSACKDVEGSESLITFRALKKLIISCLPNLESWHEEFESVAFPELETLKITNCPKLKSVLTHMPSLASLEVENSGEIKLRQISYLPMLSRLSIKLENMPRREPDEFRPPKTLEIMTIEGYENVNPLEEEEKQLISGQTRPLRILKISKSNCFFLCGPVPSKVVALEFWKYFAAVEYLRIEKCDGLVLWPKKELSSLECLKQLTISNCRNLTGALIVQQQVSSLGDSSSLTLPQSLPHLKVLRIYYCPELVRIPVVCSKSLETLDICDCRKLNIEEMMTHVITNPMELKMLIIEDQTHWRVWPDNMGYLSSLKYLWIKKCPGIEAFPHGLRLPSLENLTIWECPGIVAFPPGLDLPSLENLCIESCPGIKSFPPGLQERLRSLRYLEIKYCPALERRCRSGGDYYHLVSPIPEKDIGHDEPKGKSFLKNLPCIRGT
ncbi:hypothetical protein LUZ61_014154 [Rhynchospora tenuis]|uniref:Uncharacterized protein n=1 Tax=Rhynchospora tenuis TaxID=198213 RepID=A0AAD5WAP1_9POAL|nr:hypothetical protein LUZ61_014154 [Rhynchospora tenuis]